VLTAAERGRLAGLLAALHRSAPAVPGLRRAAWLPLRAQLEAALGDLHLPWSGGPFAEPARELLARTHCEVRSLLGAFDELRAQVAAGPGELVVTHGEPHPGNLIWAGGALMLIDWDTVGLGPPERDLWMIAGADGAALRVYADATGRAADPAALALFRLRWTLDDISSFVSQLRSRHDRTPGSEHAWRSLNQSVGDAVAAVTPAASPRIVP
jgi:spectinomycin phosphotransferase